MTKEVTEYLPTEKVAEIFGVAIRSVYRWIDEGKLHPLQVGRFYLFDKEEIEQFKEERKSNPRIQAREKRAK